MEKLSYDFFDKCSSLNDAARKIFGRDNYRDCEKIKNLAKEHGFDWKEWGERRKKKEIEVVCLNCGKHFKTYESGRKFCSHSCSAKYNNRQKGHKPLIKHTVCEYCGKDIYNKQYGTKYCSLECQIKKQREDYLSRWKSGEESGRSGMYGVSRIIRNYLFEKNNCKCEKCGWGEVNEKTGQIPLQIHHKDGNCLNNSEENLQLLCPNCHSLTDTFGNSNKNSKRVYRKQKGNI